MKNRVVFEGVWGLLEEGGLESGFGVVRDRELRGRQRRRLRDGRIGVGSQREEELRHVLPHCNS